MLSKHTVKQQRTYSIYELDLHEIDGDLVADNIKKFLSVDQSTSPYFTDFEKFDATYSSFRLHELTNIFDDVFKLIELKVQEIDDLINPSPNKIKPTLARSWCIKYQKGNSLDWHRHEDRFAYNSVYYPTVDDSTAIIIEDCSQNSSGILEITPKKGSLLVMQGATKHRVPEITSDQLRLAIACDFAITPFKNRSYN